MNIHIWGNWTSVSLTKIIMFLVENYLTSFVMINRGTWESLWEPRMAAVRIWQKATEIKWGFCDYFSFRWQCIHFEWKALCCTYPWTRNSLLSLPYKAGIRVWNRRQLCSVRFQCLSGTSEYLHSGVILRARHLENCLAVRTILSGWFDHLTESFSQNEVQL